MKRRLLYFLIADALADLRAWLASYWFDAGQSIALIEADARAALIRAKGVQ